MKNKIVILIIALFNVSSALYAGDTIQAPGSQELTVWAQLHGLDEFMAKHKLIEKFEGQETLDPLEVLVQVYNACKVEVAEYAHTPGVQYLLSQGLDDIVVPCVVRKLLNYSIRDMSYFAEKYWPGFYTGNSVDQVIRDDEIALKQYMFRYNKLTAQLKFK